MDITVNSLETASRTWPNELTINCYLFARATCERRVVSRDAHAVIRAVAIEFTRLLPTHSAGADITNKTPYPLVAVLAYLVFATVLLVVILIDPIALRHRGNIHALSHCANLISSLAIS